MNKTLTETEPNYVTQGRRNPNLALNIGADGINNFVAFDTTKTEDEYKALADNYVATFLEDTQVGKIMINPNYKRTIIDSDVVDSILYNVELNEDGTPKKDANGNSIKTVSQLAQVPWLNSFRAMIERNIDVVDMVIASTKKHGAEAWLSIRMNDHHYPDDPGFNSSLCWNRASEVGVNGSKIFMDYTNKVVQNYYKGYICELCENYDIDGIELDILRSAPYMSTVNSANITKLNSYIRELRETINEVAAIKGKKIRLSARVYSTPQHNIDLGLDPAQWVADGLIDTLTVEGCYIPTYYDIPIETWRSNIDAKNIDKHPYTLLAGYDWAVRCDSTDYSGYAMTMTLEQLKGFAGNMYNRGADGIYIFNFYADATSSSHRIYSEQYHVDENGVKTSKDLFKDKLLATASRTVAEQGMRAYVNTTRDYNNTLYPISVTDNNGYTVNMNTGTKPTKGYYSIVIGIGDNNGYTENNLSVTVNGTKTTQLTDVPKANDFTWAVSPYKEPVADHVSETAPRVMQFVVDDLSAVNDGINTISITNTATGKPQSVKWLEVRVDNIDGAKPLERK